MKMHLFLMTVSRGHTHDRRTLRLLFTSSNQEIHFLTAQLYEVSADTIRWANDLSKNAPLKQGQILTILPVTGIIHTVMKGDTIASIASKYKGDVTEAGGRAARRRHRRADGRDRRSRRPLFASAISGSAMSRTWCCRMSPTRSAGVVEGARQDRPGDAERQSGHRHYRLPGAGLLLAGQRPLDPDRAGAAAALRQPRHAPN